MTILFEIPIIVGRDIRNRDTKLFEFDYDIIKEDLDEFAKEEGYANGLELVKDEARDLFKEDEEELAEAEDNYEHNAYLLHCYLSKETEKRFAKFIANLYQEKVEMWLLEVLTHNSDKSLNDLIYYDFVE